MAGSVRIDFVNDSWWVKLYDGDGQLVDIYEVEKGELTITKAAYGQIYFVKKEEK